MQKSILRKTLKAALICCLTCFAAFFCVRGSGNGVALADNTDISINGIQMRAITGTNDWYAYLVIQSEAYSGLADKGDSYESKEWETRLTAEKIRLYTSEEDTTGKTLSELGVINATQNRWGVSGVFLCFNGYYSGGYGGSEVYKVVIEEGCELPIFGETMTSVSVNKKYTYINGDYGKAEKKLSAMSWTKEVKVVREEISLDGVQMRGLTDGWYQYVVLQSSGYAGMSATDGNFAKTYTTFDKIRLYTSENDTTGTPLSELNVQHAERNFGGWTDGLFINFAEYDSTYGGDQVYKIVIEQGCELLADLGDGEAKVFVTDKRYTYINGDYGNAEKKLSAMSWAKEVKVVREEISLDGVQMRGATNGWYYYLVLQSSAYNGMSATDGNFAKTYTTFDKIRLYTSENDTTGTPLSALTVQHAERNFGGWTDGLFINFAEYDSTYGGHQVYKIVIEQGCELLAELGTEEAKVFVINKEYIFYNQSYGYEKDKLSAMHWSESSPLPVEYRNVSVSGIQTRGWADNGWYQFLVIRSEAFADFSKTETLAFWKLFITENKIKIYTKDDDGKETGVSLSELTVNHVGANFWDTGSYINFAEYAEKYNGKTIYKVEISEGCTIPAGEKDGKLIVLKVDNDYTFYNNSYMEEGKEFENFEWSETEMPDKVGVIGTAKIETVTNQCGDNRYLIIRFGENFDARVAAAFFETKGYSNVLDKVLLYSGNDLTAEPVTLRSIWTGEINLRQYGSPTDIGFSVKNEEKWNGTNLYAVKILAGCEIPFVKNGVFGNKVVEKEITFVNTYFGLSGDIPGSYDSEYQTPRKYENFAVEWRTAAIIEYKVEGLEGVSYKKECAISGSKINASVFEKEGYDLTVTDNLGYSYYGEIIVPNSDVEITLKYSAAEIKPDDGKEENSGGCAGRVSSFGGRAFVCSVIALGVALSLKRRKSKDN